MISQTDIETLTPDEKLRLVGEIWTSLASNPGDVPVSEAEKLLLDERWARHEQDPGTALTMEAFKRRVSAGE
jgi:putative addiction module component (TIGR02574 family)